MNATTPNLNSNAGMRLKIRPDHLWSFVIEDHRGRFILLHAACRDLHLDTSAMVRAREYFLDYHNSHWKSRLLLPFAQVELAIATVAATHLTASSRLEVIPYNYRPNAFFTAAFHQPELFLPYNPALSTKQQTLVIPLSSSRSTVGADVIVFRLRFEKARIALQVSLIALVAVGAGFGTGWISGNAELGVAVAAAWIQFAQITLAMGRGRRWPLSIGSSL